MIDVNCTAFDDGGAINWELDYNEQRRAVRFSTIVRACDIMFLSKLRLSCLTLTLSTLSFI